MSETTANRAPTLEELRARRDEILELISERGPRSPDDLADPTLEAATLHWLQIIGEAAKRVSSELRERHLEVPWRAMSADGNGLFQRP